MSVALERAFLADIIEHPDDDTPRLVYADWLTDQGDAARAEFIRLQVELERQPLDAPGRPALEDRADDLLAEHEERWMSPVPAHLTQWTWRRGFLERVEFLGSGSVADMARLCSGHPLAETYWSARDDVLIQALDSPESAELPALHLYAGHRVDPFLEGLASRPTPANLTGLTLPNAAPAAVAEHSCAPGLTRLDLGRVSASELADALAVGAWPRLNGLRAFWNAVANSGCLAPLFAAPRAARWHDLDLGNLAPDVLPRLACLSAVRRLKLSPSQGPVASLSLPPALTALTFWASGYPGELLSTLAETDGVERLRSLWLYVGLPFQSEDLAALGRLLGRLRGPVLTLFVRQGCTGFLAGLLGLAHLDRVAVLKGDYIPEPAEVAALCACPSLTGLRDLSLGFHRLSESEMRLLATAPWLDRLRVLDLGEAEIGAGGVPLLLQPPRLRRLTSLSLNRTAMSAPALAALETWPGLSRLRDLTINQSDFARAEPLLLRLAGLSALARVPICGQLPEEDRQRLRERHGRRAGF